MAHERCWVLVPLGHESLTPSTTSLRIALSQGSKARCKTFISERQQYPIHHSWANGCLPHPFTFPSTLTTMMGTYYVKVVLSRKLSRGRGCTMWETFASKIIEQLVEVGGGSNLRVGLKVGKYFSHSYLQRRRRRRRKDQKKGSWFGNKVWLS